MEYLAALLNRTILSGEPEVYHARSARIGGQGKGYLIIFYTACGEEVPLQIISSESVSMCNTVAVPELKNVPSDQWLSVIDSLDWNGRNLQDPGATNA